MPHAERESAIDRDQRIGLVRVPIVAVVVAFLSIWILTARPIGRYFRIG